MPVAIAEERAPTKAVDTIYLGNTAFAAAHGIDFKAFADEEWMCRSIDGALVIGGAGGDLPDDGLFLDREAAAYCQAKAQRRHTAV